MKAIPGPRKQNRWRSGSLRGGQNEASRFVYGVN